MILSNEKLGESYKVILDDRITKEEFEDLKKGNSSVIKQLKLAHKELVAASLLEDYHGYAIEDEDGMIHLMSIATIVRSGLDDLIKNLPEIGDVEKDKE